MAPGFQQAHVAPAWGSMAAVSMMKTQAKVDDTMPLEQSGYSSTWSSLSVSFRNQTSPAQAGMSPGHPMSPAQVDVTRSCGVSPEATGGPSMYDTSNLWGSSPSQPMRSPAQVDVTRNVTGPSMYDTSDLWGSSPSQPMRSPAQVDMTTTFDPLAPSVYDMSTLWSSQSLNPHLDSQFAGGNTIPTTGSSGAQSVPFGSLQQTAVIDPSANMIRPPRDDIPQSQVPRSMLDPLVNWDNVDRRYLGVI